MPMAARLTPHLGAQRVVEALPSVLIAPASKVVGGLGGRVRFIIDASTGKAVVEYLRDESNANEFASPGHYLSNMLTNLATIM